MATVHALCDPAPVGVPAGVKLHHSLPVTALSKTLLELMTTLGEPIPTWTAESGEFRYPRSLLVGPAPSGSTVVVAWDGQTPTFTPVLGFPVTEGCAVRLPYPAGIRVGAISFVSNAPVSLPVTFEA